MVGGAPIADDGSSSSAAATTGAPERNPANHVTTLDDIIAHKRAEVEERKSRRSLDDLRELIAELGRPRNFFGAVVRRKNRASVAVIAEIKRRSPSAGLIRPEYDGGGFDPARIARQYHANGAAAISCLTDERFFGGSLDDIHRVRDAAPLPVLRKDFIIDPWQIWESRAAGADAILLIAERLKEGELIDLMILARQLELTTLIEVHSMDDLLRVRPHVGFPSRSYCLLGINNRDLNTMRVDLNNTFRLLDLVDDPEVLVSESGVSTPEDLDRLRARGVHIALVGESLMRDPNPGAALARLLRREPAP